MSFRNTQFGWGMLLAGVVATCGVLLGTSPAQPPATVPVQAEADVDPNGLLPSEPVLFLEFKGQNAVGEAWKKTAQYEAFYESGLADVISRVISSVGQQANEQEFAALTRLWTTLVNEGFKAGVWVSPGNGGAPGVHGVIVLPNAAELEPEIASRVKQYSGLNFATNTMKGRTITSTMIPDSPGVEFGWWTEGGHLVLTVGTDAINAAVDVAVDENQSIANSKLYQQANAEKDDYQVAVTQWMDFTPLRRQFGEMPLPMESPEGGNLIVNDVLEILGLKNLGAAIATSGYKGRAVWTEAAIQLPEPRTGLAALFDTKPITLDDLPPLPANTYGFAATSINPSKIYSNLIQVARDGSRLGPPDAAEEVDQMIRSIPQQLGFDPQRAIFDSLGDLACVYTDASQGSFGFGAVLKVKNPVRLMGTLQYLIGVISAETDREEFSVDRTNTYGGEVVTLRIGNGFFNPSFTLEDGWLVAGLSPQVPQAFLLRKNGRLPSWEPDEMIQEALAEMPKEYTAISVTDTKRAYEILMGYAPFLGGFLEGAAAQELGREGIVVPFKVSDIPPAELVTKSLFPTVTVGVSSEDEIRYITRASVPPLPLVGGGQGAVAAPIAVALLLPAVQQAREAARRSTSKNNLKQIGLAMHNYHDTFNHLPTATIDIEKLKPEEELSFFVSLLPFLDQAPLYEQIDTKAGWKASEDWLREQPMTFVNPSTPRRGSTLGTTDYVGIAGVGADAPTLPAGHKRAGIFRFGAPTRFRDITDGTSNTIMVADAKSETETPWGVGGKSTIRALTKRPYINGPDGIGSFHTGGVQVLFADGSVRFISENIDPGVLEALVTMSGGEVVDSDF